MTTAAPPRLACIDCPPGTKRKVDPRSLETHKRSPRCTTHWRAWRNGQRAARSAYSARRRSGVSDEVRAAVWALQGERCPCGRRPTRAPDQDHDHAVARQRCEHDEARACETCYRGQLCRHCNRDVIVLGAPALRALADYLDDPPMARLRRERPDLFTTPTDLED